MTNIGPIWYQTAADFVARVWSPFDSGFGFIASREAGSIRWMEHAIALPADVEALAKYFADHSRRRCDLYFCPNAFRRRVRKMQHALPTPYGWVDIDDADPEAFDPPPGILIRTSPGRYQGLWRFNRSMDADAAQRISRALAYEFGADKNGWSVTKYLRVPFTYNHKPEYDRPRVTLVRADWSPLRPPRLTATLPPLAARAFPTVRQPKSNWRDIHQRFRRQLHPRVDFLIKSRDVPVFEKDRSKCIFEIIAGLSDAGASYDEIAAVLWHNPFFESKHGQNLRKLNEELSRVLSRLGRRP